MLAQYGYDKIGRFQSDAILVIQIKAASSEIETI